MTVSVQGPASAVPYWRGSWRIASAIAWLGASACVSNPAPPPRAEPQPVMRVEHRATPLDGVGQLLLVTTPGWNATTATLSRWERDAATGAWQQLGATESAVVGRAGLAWADDSLVGPDPAPLKREGDGRSPAGLFPLDTIFGFRTTLPLAASALPYVMLQPGSECVDDASSRFYNTVVDRARVSLVDWTSSERMRAIEQYEFGVIVGYNATPPRAGRGSCIFLHIWAGPQSATAGCTALDRVSLSRITAWLRHDRRPTLVQLTRRDYERLRRAWDLPTPTT